MKGKRSPLLLSANLPVAGAIFPRESITAENVVDGMSQVKRTNQSFNSMKSVKFIHNDTGNEIECFCEKIDIDYIENVIYYFCRVLKDHEYKTVGVFSFQHFSKCCSKEYIKSK